MTLKERRVLAGLRQIDVAKKLDVDQAAVSKWESGETRPSRKYHKKLSKLYGCSVEEIQDSIGKEEEKFWSRQKETAASSRIASRR